MSIISRAKYYIVMHFCYEIFIRIGKDIGSYWFLQIYSLLFIFFFLFSRKCMFEERSNKVSFFVDINKHRMIVRPEEDIA